MAIYHCSLRVFSRSRGHSAVAAAAYRSGSNLFDNRAGKLQRYDKRSGVAETFILLPKNTSGDLEDRAVLWNAAEQSEKRKNSCVARELILALPHELSGPDRLALTRDMAGWLIERYRVAVDSAIHIPVHGDDERNHHAHLLFTTRELTKDGIGAKTRILDDKVTGKEETEVIREVWEALANEALCRAGHSDIQIDRRTLEDQGIDRIPQTHIGPNAQKASENASSEEDEGEQSGETGKKGSGSGGGQAPTGKSEDKSEQGEGDEGKEEKGGSGDPVSLKLQSKVKKDHKGREIDYRVIDRLKTRQNFVAEINLLNERRAAFGEKPLKEQIADLDRLMERLDVRVHRLEDLQSKTSLPVQLLELVKEAAKMAVELFGVRSDEKLLAKLSETEEQAKEQRQHTRYGRTYRKGLHTQIAEMKTNIERLQTKQAEYSRYKGFVEKLEQEIVKHTPSIKTEVKQAPQKRVSRTTTKEFSLKLQLKASVMKEALPIHYQQRQVQVKRPASIIEVPKLVEAARERFEAPKVIAETPRLQERFAVRAESQAPKDKEPAYKIRNVATFKGIAKEIERRERVDQPFRVPAAYKQSLKGEIKGLKAEATKRGRNFVTTQQQINERRAASQETVKGKFNKPEDHGPKRVRTGNVISRSKERASEVRKEVHPKYRAKPYEDRSVSSKKNIAREFRSARRVSNEAAEPLKENPQKMSHGFNAHSKVSESETDSAETSPEIDPTIEI